MANQVESIQQQPLGNELDLAPYVLTAPMAIGYELRQLASNATALAAYFNQGHDMLLTRVLAVDVKAKTFVFDVGGHAPSNDALRRADKILLVAAPDGVKVQFSIAGAQLCQFEGKPAFTAAFPPDLIKLQRREYFRLTTPVAKPYFCRARLADGAELRMDLHDISLGGFGAWLPAGLAGRVEAGQQYEEAWLELGAQGVLKLGFEVRSVREARLNSGTRWFVGCQYLKFTHAVEANLQRVLVQLERERRALVD
ncbi:flagellar brake protein [Chitinilyticum litopenaei]|uniref:flagellar brake protein n=1 Tax=Chitinilyticum litopenaei TaxID=1121276 RepID=UPI0004100E70|nr:flagellar brake protein [Chitinilyticum litopenaei]